MVALTYETLMLKYIPIFSLCAPCRERWMLELMDIHKLMRWILMANTHTKVRRILKNKGKINDRKLLVKAWCSHFSYWLSLALENARLLNNNTTRKGYHKGIDLSEFKFFFLHKVIPRQWMSSIYFFFQN